MALSLQRLRYFQIIAREGSLSAASRVLNVAQPALTYHLVELEKALGASLFERSSKGLKITTAGEILKRSSGEFLQKLDETVEEIRSTAHVPQGNVVIALAVTMARQLVPVLLQDVSARYPRVSVKIIDAGSVPSAELLNAGRVELALVPNAGDLTDADAEPIYQERLCLIEKSGTARPSRRPIRFADIGDRPLVLPSPAYDLRKRTEDASLATRHRLNVRYEQESQEIIRSLVLAGVAATITQVAQFDPISERPILDARPIIEPEINRTHAIVWRRERPPSLAARAVADTLRASIAELVKRRILPGQVV